MTVSLESVGIDAAKIERFLDAHVRPAPGIGRVVQLGVTGAHFYGFPSPDSDVDLKGVHMVPPRDLLGLETPLESVDRLLVFEDLEHDLTTHDAARALALLLRGNGNVLERLLSPLQVLDTPEARALAELARGAISRRFAGHYKGFFKGMQREHALKRRAKTMLYSFRVALTGVHLLREGECVGDATELGPRYGFDEVAELARFKAEAHEKAELPEAWDHELRKRWTDLEDALVAAEAESELPDQPENRAAMNQWLTEQRLAAL